ncbi:uncharacterized protein METZ01_LOCUS439801, partial [marine metagenome]
SHPAGLPGGGIVNILCNTAIFRQKGIQMIFFSGFFPASAGL